MNILTQLVELHKEAESPRQFFYWAGLSLISAVVRKNVWVNKRGVYKLYPSMYVMLVARSGLRKGLPVKIAQKLIEQLKVTKVISGRNSMEVIMKDLAKQYSLEGGGVLSKGQGFIVNDELGTLIIKSVAAQTLLTSLFDSFYHETYTYNTISGGKIELKDVCVTMLTATNKEHLDEFLDAASVRGGFIGRTILVYADKKATSNPLIGDSDEEDSLVSDIDYSGIVEHLRCISKLSGGFSIDCKARKLYQKYYRELESRFDSGEISDTTGTYERVHDNVLKIASLISLADENAGNMKITEDHMREAIELGETTAANVEVIIGNPGKGEDSDKQRIFLDFLIGQGNGFSALRSKILRHKFGDISAPELDRIVDTFSQAGIIRIENSNQGVLYTLEPKYAEKFKKALEGRN